MAILSSTYIKPTLAEAPYEPQEAPREELDPKEVLRRYSTLYHTSYEELEAVIFCESGWRVDVYGDGGRAYSLLQFHQPTFNAWEKELGEDLDYKSWHDQIKLGAWAFSKGTKYKKHWTCSYIVGILEK